MKKNFVNKNKKRETNEFKIFKAFLVIFLISCFSCRTLSDFDKTSTNEAKAFSKIEESFFTDDEISWLEFENGFKRFSYENSALKIKYELVQINLSNPKLELICLNVNPDKNGQTKVQNVERFAKDTNSIVAINTTPFSRKFKRNVFSKASLVGLQIANGKIESEANPNYSAIAFFKNERDGFFAEIFDSQDEIMNLPEKPEFAFGGFWTILQNDEIRHFENIKNIRAAVALKDNGETLILFAGLNFSYEETAILFKKLGADSAMQFDGGNSTNLVINGKSALNYGLKTNVPGIIGFRLKKKL